MVRLTEVQLAVMRVLWRHGEATVPEVQEALRPERTLAATTVATLLSRLEARGVVTHDVRGRQFVYRARVRERDVRRSALLGLVDGVFGGDAGDAVTHLLAEHEIGPDDLARIRALIEAKERELGAAGEEA